MFINVQMVQDNLKKSFNFLCLPSYKVKNNQMTDAVSTAQPLWVERG